MNGFHVNPETGEAGPCSAKIKCRFGSDTTHYSTLEEAQESSAKEKGIFEPKKLSKSNHSPKELIGEAEEAKAEILKENGSWNKSKKEVIAETLSMERDFQDIAPVIDEQTIRGTFSEGMGLSEEGRKIAMNQRQHQKVFKNQVESLINSRKSNPELQDENFVTAFNNGKVERVYPDDQTKLSQKDKELAETAKELDPKTMNKFMNLPTRYYSAFENEHAKKGYSRKNLKTLVEIADKVHKENPKWEPTFTSFQKENLSEHAPRFGPGGRPRNIKDLQQTSQSTNILLQKHVIDTFGKDRAKEFWSTVESRSANRPTLDDFSKAFKNFK